MDRRRTKEVFRGKATLVIRMGEDGGMEFDVRVDADGSAPLRRALFGFSNDLASASDSEIADMAARMS